MSVIGPRPALWNQDVLIAEREKYHANLVTVMWANEQFDPNHPDTFFERVKN